MGVPDFLKFVARSAPGALCRLPKHQGHGADAHAGGRSGDAAAPAVVTTSALLEYDYVLVDVTNAAQTIGLERLAAFLRDPRLIVHKAVVLALDAGRTREGTARHHRQAHLMVSDLDVKALELCSSLTDHFRQLAITRARQQQKQRGGKASQMQIQVPYVVMSGRGVAGEADYKVLDLQRNIVATALANKDTELPRFLFISEDSDILCGALCGPAPQNVSIATNLRDTLFELSILRLEHVLTYVAVCVDALVDNTEAARDEEEAGESPFVVDVPMGQSSPQAPETEAPAAEEAETTNATDGQAKEDDNVVRRKKQYGPMVAEGKRVTLDDSDSDEEDMQPAKKAPATTAAKQQPRGVTNGLPGAAKTEKTEEAEKAAQLLSALPPFKLAAGTMIHRSCVDLVFLFIVVMGNGVNVPPLVRGVTKVDIASCWQSYCKLKFTSQGVPGVGGFMTQEEQDMGRSLITVADGHSDGGKGSDSATLSLNCRFLLSILESVHYADAQSRPPVDEERNRAIAYLSNATYATLRYMVASNLSTGAALEETFLDSRPLAETEVLVPSLAAVLWVLGQEGTRAFTYPLQGLAKRELLALANGEGSHGASSSPMTLRSSSDVAQKGGRDATAAGADSRGSRQKGTSSLELSVGDALVCPPSTTATATSWAMARSGNSAGATHTYSISHIIATPNTVSLGGSGGAGPSLMRGGAGTTGSASRHAQSVAALIRALADNRRTFAALADTWRRSVGLAVSELQAVARTSRFMSPVTGNVVEGPLSSAAATATRSTGEDSGSGAAQGGTKLVYSFELRRMTPLLTTAADGEAAEEGKSAASGPKTEGKAAVSTPAAASGASSASSAAQAALQAALGLSLDYTKAPPPPTNVVVDPQELKLVQPVKRRKREANAAGDKPSEPSKKPKTEETNATAAEGETEKKKYRRPGKKERKRRQQEARSEGKS